MTTLTFDTLKYADKLKEAGIPDAQAEGQARALAEVMVSSDLATKADIGELRLELQTAVVTLKGAIVDAKTDNLKWMFSLMVGQTAITAGIIFALQRAH